MSTSGESGTATSTTELKCCPWCGYFPGNPHGFRQMLADRLVRWLVHEDGGLVERRFCIRCAPRTAVVNLECAYCRDGPLLAGEPNVSLSWLTRLGERVLDSQGWSIDASGVLTCPRCRLGSWDADRLPGTNVLAETTA